MFERIHFKILTAVDQFGSVTAAAEHLNLTQSALSHTIKKLENILGASIWLKRGRTIEFTPLGILLLKESKRLLPQFERIDFLAKQHAKGLQGELRIGMECHPCYRWLLNVVDVFLKHKQDVDLDIKQRFQFGGLDALMQHEIDVLVTPDPIPSKQIMYTPVFDYEQVLVVSEHNTLSKKNYVEAKDLSSHILYTYPVSVERLDIYNQFLLPNKCYAQVRKTTESTELMLQFIVRNKGVSVLPRWLASQYQETMPITLLKIGEDGIHKRIHLGVRNEDYNTPLIQSFFQIALSGSN